MARKQMPSKVGSEVKSMPAAAPAVVVSTTPVRNTAIPKVTVKKEVTHQMIAERAYYISQSGTGGSEYDNWVRAERELRA